MQKKTWEVEWRYARRVMREIYATGRIPRGGYPGSREEKAAFVALQKRELGDPLEQGARLYIF